MNEPITIASTYQHADWKSSTRAATKRNITADAERGVTKRSCGPASAPLNNNNKGFKMLRDLGWVPGQGLGAASLGEVAPISSTMSMQRSRHGLGS